jgi:hypothetical protein
MAANFSANSVQITSLGTSKPQQAFGGNGNRVSLILSFPTCVLPNTGFGVSTNNASSGLFLNGTTPFNGVLPYRDYGPLIKGDIWIDFGNGGEVATVTEIVKIG